MLNVLAHETGAGPTHWSIFVLAVGGVVLLALMIHYLVKGEESL